MCGVWLGWRQKARLAPKDLVHAEILAMSEGYGSRLGERGVGLSGGQKQRIAVARALMLRPKVIIMDESIAGLDSEAAKKVCDAINSLKGKVTVLFVSHTVPENLPKDVAVELK